MGVIECHIPIPGFRPNSRSRFCEISILFVGTRCYSIWFVCNENIWKAVGWEILGCSSCTWRSFPCHRRLPSTHPCSCTGFHVQDSECNPAPSSLGSGNISCRFLIQHQCLLLWHGGSYDSEDHSLVEGDTTCDLLRDLEVENRLDTLSSQRQRETGKNRHQ